MLGIRLQKLKGDKLYPAYLTPITDRLDEFAAQGTRLTSDVLFPLLLNPKPLQLFFALYLTNDLSLIDHMYRSEIGATQEHHLNSVPRIIQKAKDASFFLDDRPADQTREKIMYPMKWDEFNEAIPGMMNPHVQGISAILQSGINDYITELGSILQYDYDVSEQTATIKRLFVGRNFQSLWMEFLPFLGLCHQQNNGMENPFQKAFHKARDNQAFKALKRDSQETVTCPAQHMIKHLLNTNFIEEADGSLTIAKEPQAGALPLFIYKKLQGNSGLKYDPAPDLY